jgi:hypothetical protein
MGIDRGAQICFITGKPKRGSLGRWAQCADSRLAGYDRAIGR